MKYEELLQLPKVELHCHLDGSLSQEFLSQELGRNINLSELQAAWDCESLAEYLARFDIPLRCIQTEKALRGTGYDFLRTVAKENIKYVEVRFAPLSSVHDDLTTEKVIRAVLEGLEKGKQEFGVDYNVIVCAMRHQSEEQNLQMFRTAREFLGAGVCAADLAGDEASFPMSGFKDLFAQVKKMEMPFVIHAGECGDPQNIADAVDCGASRIGHGIAMGGRPEIQKLCRDAHVGIEMCPISNLQTKAVSGPECYPMREFLDAGLLVTVNTDNRTVSNTSVTTELQFIQEKYGIRDEEIFRLMENAVEASFADDRVKQRLYNCIREQGRSM